MEVASNDDVGHAFHVNGDECFHADFTLVFIWLVVN
jgi:hypothetical protein